MNMNSGSFLQFYMPAPMTIDLYFLEKERMKPKLEGCTLYIDATGHVIKKRFY